MEENPYVLKIVLQRQYDSIIFYYTINTFYAICNVTLHCMKLQGPECLRCFGRIIET